MLKEAKNKAEAAEKFNSFLGIPTSSNNPLKREKGHDKGDTDVNMIFDTNVFYCIEC